MSLVRRLWRVARRLWSWRNPVKYYVLEHTNYRDTDLLRFRRPDERSLVSLQTILEQLPETGWESFDDPTGFRTKKKAKAIGDLATIMQILSVTLSKDAAVTEKDWYGGFENVVQLGWGGPGSVKILTRLFMPGEEGAVFYGRTVLRISEREFAIWIDD